jgi:adenylate cyclase
MMDKQRRMTVLFADVSDATRLIERLGSTEAAYAVERCMKRMERAIAGHRGRLVKTAEGGMLAEFASAEQACLAAIDMQERVAKLPPVSGLKLAIRIGLHSGAADAEQVAAGAKRIAARAGSDQILACPALVGELPDQASVTIRARPDLRTAGEDGATFTPVEIVRHGHEAAPRKPAIVAAERAPAALPPGRLCVRYRGNAYLLDDQAPLLTLGRDPASKLVIADRKGSRTHARIERRNGRYFYADNSTNGSYISGGDQPEFMVRRREIELKGSGLICFGASLKDPKADCAEFEHL